MKRCVLCGYALKDDARFCNKCGTPQSAAATEPAVWYCGFCHAKVEEPAIFCTSCGRPKGSGSPIEEIMNIPEQKKIVPGTMEWISLAETSALPTAAPKLEWMAPVEEVETEPAEEAPAAEEPAEPAPEIPAAKEVPAEPAPEIPAAEPAPEPAVEKAAEEPAAEEWECPTCHLKVPGHYRFCFECGTRKPEKKTCGVCGNVVPSGHKFCFNCGNPLK